MQEHLKRAVLFVGLTFLLSWGLFGFFFLFFREKTSSALWMVMAIFYMFMPGVAALVMQKFVCHEPIPPALAINFKINAWFFVAWLLPALLALAAWGVGLLIPGVELSWNLEGMMERIGTHMTAKQMVQIQQQIQASPIHPLWLVLLQGLLAGPTVNAIAGLGEELGWRGFLQKELAGFGFWRSALIIGLIWGLWHMPLILQGHNYPQHPQLGVYYMTYFTMLYAPIFSYIRLKAKSVIAPAILHGSLNGTAGVAFIALKGGSDLTTGMTGWAGLIVLLFANLGLFLFDRFFTAERIMAGRNRPLTAGIL